MWLVDIYFLNFFKEIFMKVTVKSFIVSTVILLWFIGYQTPQITLGSESHGHVCTACDKGKAGEAVWCDSCNAGFIDGKKITCKGCFDSKTKGTVCKTCQKK